MAIQRKFDTLYGSQTHLRSERCTQTNQIASPGGGLAMHGAFGLIPCYSIIQMSPSIVIAGYSRLFSAMKPITVLFDRLLMAEAKLVSRNPIIGAGFLLLSTIVIVFWLPAELYNWTHLTIAVSIPLMFALQSAHLLAIFRRLKF
ncbi:hypothetical protein [uncultured Tateyamaria sp.]|uniref:hypothetical protein n=1 Tax=uncultured Tateyamaria sp. TaxID=455651 RepID=UPI00260AC662|nr:hypothetical protein [uncultured Tateyamaria sp.]